MTNAARQQQHGLTGRACVLHAEDDRLTSLATARLLSIKGFKVETAANGREALLNLLSQPNAYDLIITDQVMPSLTGEEWLKGIREISFSRKIIMYAFTFPGIWRVACGNWVWNGLSTHRRACNRSWTRFTNCWENHENTSFTRRIAGAAGRRLRHAP